MSVGREKYIFNTTTLDEMLDKQSKEIELLELRIKELGNTETKYHEVRRFLCNVTSAECDISKYIQSEMQRCKHNQTHQQTTATSSTGQP